MSFSFNSQMSKSEYTIQIATDNYEQFLFMQDMARECIDGKHKEKKGDTETFSEHYGLSDEIDAYSTYVMTGETCKDIRDVTTGGTLSALHCANCPTNSKNGGSGICNCTLAMSKIT